jgi:hypothetical protein
MAASALMLDRADELCAVRDAQPLRLTAALPQMTRLTGQMSRPVSAPSGTDRPLTVSPVVCAAGHHHCLVAD